MTETKRNTSATARAMFACPHRREKRGGVGSDMAGTDGSPSRTEFDDVFTDFGKHRPNSTKFGRLQPTLIDRCFLNLAGFVQIVPLPPKFGPKSTNVDCYLNLADLSQCSANFDQILAALGKT